MVDHCQNMAIFLKLLLTPVLIAIATLASRRYGPAFGGWLAGLPLVSGPVSIFLPWTKDLTLPPPRPGPASRARGRCRLLRSVRPRRPEGRLAPRGARRDRRISPGRIIPGAHFRWSGRLFLPCPCGHFRGPDHSGPPLLGRRCPCSCLVGYSPAHGKRRLYGARHHGMRALPRSPVERPSVALPCLRLHNGRLLPQRGRPGRCPSPVVRRHHRVSRLGLVLPPRGMDGQAAYPPLYVLRSCGHGPSRELDLPYRLHPRRSGVSRFFLRNMPDMTQ